MSLLGRTAVSCIRSWLLGDGPDSSAFLGTRVSGLPSHFTILATWAQHGRTLWRRACGSGCEDHGRTIWSGVGRRVPSALLECLRHSRYWSRRMGLPISRLCLADKLAFALAPAWLYLPMARWTGELREYMMRSRERQAGDSAFTDEEARLIRSASSEEWLRGLQSYTLRWVDRHRDQWTPFQPTTRGQNVRGNEGQAIRVR